MNRMLGVTIGALLVVAIGGLLMSPFYFIAPAVPLGIVGLFVLYRYPHLGLLALIFFVPLEGLFAGNKLFTGSKLVGIAMMGIVAMRLLFGHTPIRNLLSRQWIAIFLLLAAFLLSGMFSPYPDLSREMVKDLVTAVVIFVIAITVGDQLRLRHLMMALSVSVAITAGMSLFSTQYALQGRATGLMTDPNYFALLLVTAAPFNLYLILHSRPLILKAAWLVLLGLDLMALQKTLSRSGLLVLLLAFATLGWHYRDVFKQLNPRHIGLFIAASAVSLVVMAVVIPDEYVERILSLTNFSGVQNFEDRSLGRRTSYVVVGMQLFKAHPLLGAGPGTFPVYYSLSGFATAFSDGMDELEIFRRAHNTYLELLAETGLSGFLAFVTLALSGLFNFHRARLHAIALGNRESANEIAHTGATYLALITFLLFLSATQHKYFWTLLALSELAVRPYLESRKSFPAKTSASEAHTLP